jgi:hypothetical protein
MSQDALDLLLSGVKDQGQRKQITSAYYAFASGDPETFAVQFAVLLRAHAISLKLLPARLEKAFAAETRKLGDLVIAHQNSVHRMAALIGPESRKNGVGEGTEVYLTIQQAIENQLIAHAEVFRAENEKATAAIAAQDRLLRMLGTRRILLTVILSYIGGVLSTLLFQELLSFFETLFH